MLIERTDKEIIIRLPATVDTDDLLNFVNYARYKEITSKFNVPQKKIDKLATDVNKGWWARNRKNFIK